MLFLRSVDRIFLNKISFIRSISILNFPLFVFRISNSILFIFAILFALCAMPLSVADAATATLGWDSNPEPDLEGYVVYRNVGSPGPPYGYSSDLPEDELADPLHPKVTLTGLQKDKEYFIALTAYNTEGVESSFSNDVCVEIVDGIVEPCASSSSIGASTSSSGGGGGGGACFISTTSHESSMFSKFIAQPVIRSQLLAIVFLLLILLSAVKLGFNKTHRK
ncbi:MAG: hypothetical protein BBJ57_08400 [Desulfobacterales bacterium PC51MH44]|nr:MAG: hypothetical protein BBJ57_08400 [Desulfobacterales bacterium PC51MH44]